MIKEIEHAGHKITIRNEAAISGTKYFSAVATICPSATKLSDMDIILGVGDNPLPAIHDAIAKAKALIDFNAKSKS